MLLNEDSSIKLDLKSYHFFLVFSTSTWTAVDSFIIMMDLLCDNKILALMC